MPRSVEANMNRMLTLSLVLFASFVAQAHAAQKRWIVAFQPGTPTADRMRAVDNAGMAPVADLEELGIVAAAPKFGVLSARPGALKSGGRIAAVEEDAYEIWIDEVGPAPVLDLPGSLQQLPLPSVAAVLQSLPKAPRVRMTLPGAQAIPKDPELPWGIARLKLPEASSLGLGDGAGVKVAVIDTGIDADHPELKHAVKGGYNATMGPKDAWKDENSHGTHVAGTIAAARNGYGVVGVAPGVELYAVKVLDANGGGFLTDILKGMVWAGRNGMQVANMSLGSDRGVVFMQWAAQYAKVRGTVIVAAAGNSGGSVGYPAAYPETIAVSALGPDDKITNFSSRGKQVDFIAPGKDVSSTVPGGGYRSYSGTSMASPHVAGLAALAVAKGAKGLDGVKAMLSKAAKPLPGMGAEEQGAGLVDATLLAKP